MIYLDYAAGTPLDSDVARAVHEAEKVFANPSAQYKAGRAARAMLEDARRTIARQLSCKPEEVVLTSGGTESDNLAIFGIAGALKSWGGSIVTSLAEHKAVREPVLSLERKGFEVRYAKLKPTGQIDLDNLASQIDDTTVLVCISIASSEIGAIQPVAKISVIIQHIRSDRASRQVATPLYFHCDGSAGAETLQLNVNRLGVDTLSINAAKIYGPKGSGALYVRRGTKLAGQIVGGGQEFGMRAGTENLAAAAGLAAALQKAASLRDEQTKRYKQLSGQLQTALQNAYPTCEFISPSRNNLPHIVNVSLPPHSGETMVDWLDAAGFAVATGAACTAGDTEPSAVIVAIGKSRQIAQSSLRISLGRATSGRDISRFVKALQATTAKLDTIKQ